MPHSRAGLAIWLAAALAVAAVVVSAPVPRPLSFHGSITVDGNPVAAGLRVSVEIGGVSVDYAATDGVARRGRA